MSSKLIQDRKPASQAGNGAMGQETHGTAIFWLIGRGDVVGVGRLLRADPEAIWARDTMGSTPLHMAAAERRYEIVQMLIRHGADVNAVNELGIRPLHFALMGGSEELALLLLQEGADPQAETDQGVTSIMLARMYGRKVLTRHIEQLGRAA